jgi:hypothetical protein
LTIRHGRNGSGLSVVAALPCVPALQSQDMKASE